MGTRCDTISRRRDATARTYNFKPLRGARGESNVELKIVKWDNALTPYSVRVGGVIVGAQRTLQLAKEALLVEAQCLCTRHIEAARAEIDNYQGEFRRLKKRGLEKEQS